MSNLFYFCGNLKGKSAVITLSLSAYGRKIKESADSRKKLLFCGRFLPWNLNRRPMTAEIKPDLPQMLYRRPMTAEIKPDLPQMLYRRPMTAKIRPGLPQASHRYPMTARMKHDYSKGNIISQGFAGVSVLNDGVVLSGTFLADLRQSFRA